MKSMSLVETIETREIAHDVYAEILQAMVGRIDGVLTGRGPFVEWVVGPSRAGKSMLVKALERRYPESRVDGRREVPVLRIPTLAGVSPKELPSAPLERLLGVKNVKGSVKVLKGMMTDQLRLARTKVILWEEASHIVDTGTKMPPRAAGDFFKEAMDEIPVSHVFFGLPRLEKLMQSNEQLRLRAKKRWELRPYDWMEPTERRAFAGVVRTFMDMFAKAGYRIDVPFERFVQHCYLFSGGLVGVVSAFQVQLAEHAEKRGPGPVTFEHCSAAAARVEAAGHPDWPAFQRAEVTPVELNQAFAEVLRVALMAQPRRG